MLLVSVVAFLFIRLIPGDPVRLMVGEDASYETVMNVTRKLGLDKPLITQYGIWMKGILQGDLGTSFRTGRPVLEEIAPRYGKTVRLALISISWSVILGMLMGVWSGTNVGKWQDYFGVTLTVAGQAVPAFWIGLLLIYVFGVRLKVLPVSGAKNWKALILPAFTMGTSMAATVTRFTRSSLLESLKEDYIRTARAKGLKERVVIWKHGFRNSLISVVTVIGMNFGAMLGGSVLIEEVFVYPGIGSFLVSSIGLRDYVVVQALILLLSAHYVFINVFVDIVYAILNPEIRFE